MDENKQFDTENDLTVTVAHGKDVLVKEECCTCITIVLNNEGKIMTSFMGGHNPYIISQLEKAQKVYFKSLKQALKKDYNHDECCCDDHCDCGEHCECETEHECGDPKCNNKDCHCTPENHCGCYDGQPCKCGNKKSKTKTQTNKKAQ